MFTLGVVIASVREGRVGLPVAQWCAARARRDGRFDVQVIDLKELDLPLLAERKHPRFGEYDNEKQKAWGGVVGGGVSDASRPAGATKVQ